MPTYSVSVRYDTGTTVDTITGTIESGPGASAHGAQFLAVHLPDGGSKHIAIHRIYSIEELDEVPDPEANQGPGLFVGAEESHHSADGKPHVWVRAPQPMHPVTDVWDKNGDRWTHNEGMNLWETDGQQYPEPWDALLEHFGPVTDRFVG